MRILSWLTILSLLLYSALPVCYAETTEPAGRFQDFSWTTLIVNIILTLVIWRLIMAILHRYNKPKKTIRKK